MFSFPLTRLLPAATIAVEDTTSQTPVKPPGAPSPYAVVGYFGPCLRSMEDPEGGVNHVSTTAPTHDALFLFVVYFLG